MRTDDVQQVLVVLTIPPSLETELIDWLLAMDNAAGFSSHAISGHSSRHAHLSVAEQVVGRQRRTQFQVQLEQGRLDGFLAGLAADFAGADLHYWAMPLLASGRLCGDGAPAAAD